MNSVLLKDWIVATGSDAGSRTFIFFQLEQFAIVEEVIRFLGHLF